MAEKVSLVDRGLAVFEKLLTALGKNAEKTESHAREPYAWERGGGDQTLDRLCQAVDDAEADFHKTPWTKRGAYTEALERLGTARVAMNKRIEELAAKAQSGMALA
jgi:hypothetical protein